MRASLTSSLTAMIVMSAAFGGGAARAEIVSAGPRGFNLRPVTDAPNVAPPIIWAALADVAKWWDPEHTYSGDARNLSLEPFVRGCFCEKLGLYAGIEHGSVVYAMPAKTLRIQGALGPLQEFGINGVMTWQIEPAGGVPRITSTYSVGGFADRPLADWAPIVDEVLGVQLQRLARYVTAGHPEAPKPVPEPSKQ